MFSAAGRRSGGASCSYSGQGYSKYCVPILHRWTCINKKAHSTKFVNFGIFTLFSFTFHNFESSSKYGKNKYILLSRLLVEMALIWNTRYGQININYILYTHLCRDICSGRLLLTKIPKSREEFWGINEIKRKKGKKVRKKRGKLYFFVSLSNLGPYDRQKKSKKREEFQQKKLQGGGEDFSGWP